jgi:hypothetical protein
VSALILAFLWRCFVTSLAHTRYFHLPGEIQHWRLRPMSSRRTDRIERILAKLLLPKKRGWAPGELKELFWSNEPAVEKSDLQQNL